MPTNQNSYNTRVTDEALEKRFRDTFKSQGGAELVDDLYASGVIIPTVDFTAAATGETLSQNLQTAWDFSTGHSGLQNATGTVVINNTGFWQIGVTFNTVNRNVNAKLYIQDGFGAQRIVWAISPTQASTNMVVQPTFVVFLRANDSLRATVGAASGLDVWYRQIATVSGDLVNPTGFTSS